MEITVQNYRQLRNSFDTTKLNKEVLEVFNDVDADFEDYLDLYTDASPENDGIRDVVNNHIKLVNKYFVYAPKVNTEKKSDFKIGDTVYLTKKILNYEIGEELEVRFVEEDEQKLKVNCCSSDYVKRLFYVPFDAVSLKKPTSNLQTAVEKDFGKSDKIVFVAPQKTKAPAKAKTPTKTKTIKPTIDFIRLEEGVYIIDGITVDLNYNLEQKHPLNVLIYGSPQWIESLREFAHKQDKTKTIKKPSSKAPAKIKPIKVKFVRVSDDNSALEIYKGDNGIMYCKYKEEDTFYDMTDEGEPLTPIANIVIEATKAPAKPKVVKVIDKTIVDNFSPEFLLIRRFWNIIKTEKVDVPFRTVQLLYMAFNKAAVERKVRKTSEAAELFTACNKKIVTLFEDIPNEGKKPYEIDFTDKKLYNEIKEYVQDVAVNPAIPLLKRFIAMQNTKPEIKKAETLLKSMEKLNSDSKMIDNRLKIEFKDALAELKNYIKKPSAEIEPTIHGLSRPATQKVCHNRVKCTGLTKDGKLRPGYKFREDTNEVIRVSKVKAPAKRKAPIKKKRVVGLGFSENDDIEHIYVHDPVILVNNNFDKSTLYEKPIVPEPQVAEQLAAPAIEVEKPLAKNKLMQMQFDSLQMDEGWENFMQDPAKNMRLAIWGKPKNGKTAGSLQMANYLTKFGNVLYNFVDQGFNKSTQDLWLSSGLANNNKAVPTDVQTLDELEKEIKTGKYTFVFIDMISDYINREGIKPYEFKERFIKKYPKVSFILIFEVTKSGDFKGDQGWTHIVDAIVTVEDFCMENRGRYGMGHHIIWEEGLKKFNPKKYAEIQETQFADVEHI